MLRAGFAFPGWVLLSTAVVTACGSKASGPASPAASKPVASTIEELKASGVTYEVPPLAGEVSCWLGKSTLQVGDGEKSAGPDIYMRRAVDPATGIAVDDTVQIRAGSAPKRFVSTYTPFEETPEIFAITEALGQWTGTRVAIPGKPEYQFAELESGSIMMSEFTTTDQTTVQKTGVLSPGAVPNVTTTSQLADFINANGFAAVSPYVGFWADVELSKMTPEACASTFALFPPETRSF